MGSTWVQGRLRVLEHHGYLVPTQAADVLRPGLHQVHLPGSRPLPPSTEALYGSSPMMARARVLFAAPALADQAVDFAFLLAQADAVKGLDRPGRAAKLDVQVFDSQGFCHKGRSRIDEASGAGDSGAQVNGAVLTALEQTNQVRHLFDFAVNSVAAVPNWATRWASLPAVAGRVSDAPKSAE